MYEGLLSAKSSRSVLLSNDEYVVTIIAFHTIFRNGFEVLVANHQIVGARLNFEPERIGEIVCAACDNEAPSVTIERRFVDSIPFTRLKLWQFGACLQYHLNV